MTTGPEELSLDYLLDPAFQLVNTAGRPLTNGWIEVYYHGTRNKYYCASDFDGTLHPFRIPLDSLGSNIVLADPNFSYDIYVYNSFGSLQMSRYNVNPGSGSGGGSSGEGGPAEHWSSDTAGGASTTVTGGTTVYLTLPSSEDQPEFVDHTTDTAIFLKEGLYHIDAVVSFKQDEDDLQNIIKDLVVNTGLIGWDAQMTGQKNWTGPESTDDDRHFLELHTVVSVPDDLLQPLYFQISSPVDLDSAAIEKLDIVKLEAGGNGIKYTGGYGIDISNRVISVTGMMPEASAAKFVDNSTYQVDIQNIYETIADTSAMIPSGVATEQWVTDYTSAFITSADLPDLSDYATQQWVEDQHYITSADIPPIPQDVVTSGELATVSGDIVSQIPSLDGYATEQWVNEQGYLTSADLPQSVPLVAGEGISIVDTSASTIISVDSPGVSEEWVEEYVSDATSAFITSADIPDVPEDVVTSAELASTSATLESMIPSLDGYATEEWVGEQGYMTSLPDDLVTSGELATVSGDIVNQIPDVSDMATQTWVNEQGFITSLPEDLVTSGELATVSGQIMSQMPTQTSVAIEPTIQTGTKIADYVIDGTSGELYAPEGGGSTYNGIKPISVQGSDIALMYGETLTCPDPDPIQCQYRMVKDGDYAYFNNSSYEIESTNSCDIVFPDSTTVVGTSGNTLRLRLTDEINSLYINGTVNLVSNGSTAYLSERAKTFYLRSSVMRPSGRTWADMFDFSQYSLSDIEGDVRIELWEFNGDTPVQHLEMSYNRLLIYTNAVPSYLNVTYPVPSPTYNQGYVLTENGDGTYGWAAPPSGSGGSIEYPLVYSASDFNDPMTRAYAENSFHKYYTTVYPYGLTATSIRKSDNSLYGGGLFPDHLNFYVDGEDYTVSPSDIEHWNNTYSAVDTSAAYWNEAAGMNEYPISAGPGMSIEDVDGVTVFSCTGGDVPDDVVTSGQLATVSGEIMNEIPDLTGYATQTWVSDGFMETSGLEYNSQDEISGYNGHPVMTVESEKQWLTHDDTIAHVTNSAQYAFGVNVPVVAQAMGTDETVLFETSAVNGAGICPLSESLKNFEQIKVLASRGYNGSSNPNANGGTGPWSFWDTDGIMSDGADYHSVTPFIFEGYNWKNSCYSANNEYNLLTWYRGCQRNMASAAAGTVASSFTDCVGIKKIVGIGRKEN